MKKFIAVIIVSIIALYVSVASAADYTVKVPRFGEPYDSKLETNIIIKTICIDGYKFLVTYFPVGLSDSGTVSTIQMYKQQGLNAPSTPMKCSD